ncbi:MAG: hypothetical protein HWN68_13975 [Desulfobacterales bacterium]|nr:hypothetical protein [Desulfobacterales bacterium]
MSDNFTIKELLDYDLKAFKMFSDISLEATVTRALKAKERKGTKDGRDYHFFSQFVVINDGTADIGLDFTVGRVEETLAKGNKIRIEKAKAAIYQDKNDKTQRKLTKGKITVLNGTEKIPENLLETDGYYIVVGPNGKVVVSPEVLRKRDKVITRAAVAKSMIENGWRLTELLEPPKDGDTEREFEAWVKLIYKKIQEEPKPKPRKAPPKEKNEKKEEEPEDLDRDQLVGRFSKLVTEGFVKKKFTVDFPVTKWLQQRFNKLNHKDLTDDELAKAVSMLREIMAGKREVMEED